MNRALAALALLLAVAAPRATAAQAGSVTAGGGGPPTPAFATSPGQASINSGQELLQALQDGTDDILVTGPIILSQDVWVQFQLPIVIQPNRSVLIHGVDPSWIGVRQERINWGGAVNLIEISTNGALVLDGIISEHPGNFTQGLEELPLKVNGSFLWPTITGWPGSSLTIANSTIFNDDPGCSAETTQAAVLRIQSFLPPRLAGAMKYEGGTTVSYTYLPYPCPVYNVTCRQVLGTSTLTMIDTVNTCFDSLAPAGSGSGSGSSSSGGGGTPSWVWAVLGSVAGCALLAAVGGALLWRRARARCAAGAVDSAKAASSHDLETAGGMRGGSGGSGGSGGGGSGGSQKGSGGGMAGGVGQGQQVSNGTARSWDSKLMSQATSTRRSGSGDLHAALMRTRFGVIEDLQLGELLGRGAFGRVYKGRWKGALVAVKVIEHRVQPGETQHLSQESLLSMSISHPNVISTHQVVVVRQLQGEQQGMAGAVAAGGSGGLNGVSRASGRIIPGLISGDLVEVLSPCDELLPGVFETWLVVEYCDRASLADLISAGKHIPPDPAQHHAWALLCLLDIALGLHYLHGAGIIHGDLKPHNVMLKSTRTDRRGFMCKLGDFGLSRLLEGEQTHVETQSYGTASYAAPELLTDGKLSSASDIYSLALIMWELSCAAELHQGMTSVQIIMQVSQHGYRPEVPEGCPPALLSLMQRCWAQDPMQRPSAGQVVQELRGQLTALFPAASRPRAPESGAPRL